MRTIGLLGGMSYHSTLLYYSQINAHIQRRRGGTHAASLILHSFDFAEMSALFAAQQWNAVAERFVTAARHMTAAGATGIAIGCNIGHRVAPQLQSALAGEAEVLHIADFTARAIRGRGLERVALLATRTAMEADFIKGALSRGAGVDVLVPGEEERRHMDRVIFEELGAGVVRDETRAWMAAVVGGLLERKAEAVVLACTDLQFILKPEDVPVPVFDTLELHAKGLAEWALEEHEDQ